MPHVVVAGGGIGGLATALALAQAGHTVEVLERKGEFTELGAGIQLAPNAFRALARLGLAEPVSAAAVHVDALRLLEGRSGAPLAVLSLDHAYRARFGLPYAVVHRSDLYRPLLDACQAHRRITLHAGVEVTGYQGGPDQVRALTARGPDRTADALIGADGLHSAVRAQLVGDGPPRVSGHTIHRAVVPMAAVPAELRSNTVTLWVGPGWHFVHYPIAGGSRLNLAITQDDGAREAVAGLPTEREQVLARFPGLHPAGRRLLELGRDWRTWVLCDRDATTTWTDGRTAVLGDAAHPMLQYAAQGACMALEDAVVLGDLLRDCPSARLAEQLREFASLRQERTARVQDVSRWMGREVYHPSDGAAQARDALLADMSADDLMDAVDWLHAHDARGATTLAAQ
ncbi:FAD-dependent monooxygenase [Kitasatospora cathayae]|uniref:FAD-dependent monooxygenase n=1 Tax=Kitasatospora cathayae TaxID=3004092 RepID=A0ABY7Q934_9ACTN|nr:FAD-dependent monooxygenase [Kitasatospora sp. HUAS 3-15]WBP89152.1 FAD-dependent monooxygenase [Kitasatospora sp. HUAS 3-15]